MVVRKQSPNANGAAATKAEESNLKRDDWEYGSGSGSASASASDSELHSDNNDNYAQGDVRSRRLRRRSPSTPSSKPLAKRQRSCGESQSRLDAIKRRDQPDQPIHRMQDSLFSSSSGFTDFSGFLNLCLLLLFMSHSRLVLDNFLHHGFLIDPQTWIAILVSALTLTPMRLLYTSNAFILFALLVEKLRARLILPFLLVRFLILLNLLLLLLLPTVVILLMPPNPIAGCFVCGVYTILFLKLISYSSVNEWCFNAASKGSKDPRLRRSKSTTTSVNSKDEEEVVTYPNNLNLKDLYFFVLAPTLCYEVNFPRSPKRRLWFLVYRIAEMIFLTQLMLGLVQQTIFPIVHEVLEPFDKMDFPTFVERILTLAIWNHFGWLFFFYWLFHSSLNILAEVLRFGDRNFYRDWWNADSIEMFWQKWNIPVHRWCVRHLYKPLLRRGFSRSAAAVGVFFLSAFFHEFLVSVPLRMFRLWSFMGMLSQVPMGSLLRLFPDKMGGLGLRNALVWLSIIMGQPIAIFMYFHDYYVNNVAVQ